MFSLSYEKSQQLVFGDSQACSNQNVEYFGKMVTPASSLTSSGLVAGRKLQTLWQLTLGKKLSFLSFLTVLALFFFKGAVVHSIQSSFDDTIDRNAEGGEGTKNRYIMVGYWMTIPFHPSKV